jgi:hypothetical protein
MFFGFLPVLTLVLLLEPSYPQPLFSGFTPSGSPVDPWSGSFTITYDRAFFWSVVRFDF